MLTILYGTTPARAYFRSDGRLLSVSLDTDPGTGSMHFQRISPTVVEIVGGDPDDIRRAAAIYAATADYLTPGPPADRLRAESVRLAELGGLDTSSSASRQYYVDTGEFLPAGDADQIGADR